MILVNLWLSRVGYIMAFIICSSILKIEWDKKNEDTNRKMNKYEQRLRICSLSTIIFAALHSLFLILSYIPSICKYTIHFGSCCVIIYRCILTFFQITRLQYCFLNEQVHSTKNGYSQYLFIILYCVGFMVIIFGQLTWFVLDVVVQTDDYCVFIPSEYYPYFILIAAVIYYLWDGTVLALYVIKIVQINHKLFKLSDVKQYNLNIIQRVRTILNKILTLTLLYECHGVISAAVNLLLNENEYIIGGIRQFILAMDPIIVCIITYFMIEHNKDQYEHIKKLCFCKESNKNNESNENRDNVEIQQKSPDILSCDTKTVNVVPLSHIHIEGSVISQI